MVQYDALWQVVRTALSTRREAWRTVAQCRRKVAILQAYVNNAELPERYYRLLRVLQFLNSLPGDLRDLMQPEAAAVELFRLDIEEIVATHEPQPPFVWDREREKRALTNLYARDPVAFHRVYATLHAETFSMAAHKREGHAVYLKLMQEVINEHRI